MFQQPDNSKLLSDSVLVRWARALMPSTAARWPRFTSMALMGLRSHCDRRPIVGDAGGLFFAMMLSYCAIAPMSLAWAKEEPPLQRPSQSLSQAAQARGQNNAQAALSRSGQNPAGQRPKLGVQQGPLSMNQVQAGQLLFSTGEPQQYQPAILLESRADFTINGMLARVSLSQRFENDSADWVEGVYVFPLPEDAAVDHLRIRIGDRLIEGKVRERQEAKRIYQEAKASGRKASLVEQERPNLFTNNVANIGPGETVEVTIEYLQTVGYEEGEFSLRLPMTITPRYFPGEALSEEESQALAVEAGGMGWAQAMDEVPDAARVSPLMMPPAAAGEMLNPIRITGEMNMGMPLERVDSAYHDIVLNRHGERYEFNLLSEWVSMDRDFELRWRPVVGKEPQAALFSQALDGEDYALLMIMPPRAEGALGAAQQSLPKEMIFIIDTSGSMEGVSIKQATFSLQYGLEQLRPGDRFNIVEFNNDARALFKQPQLASLENVQIASEFVNDLRADGGTNMRAALETALWQNADPAYLRQVIFITDGAVGNEESLFQLIHEELGDGRLFTVGIGSAPNSFFMRKAAEFGRGSFTYIANVSETHTRMSELFSKLHSPLSTDIQIHWPDGAVVEAYPERVPDLYAGEPVLVAAKLDLLGGPIRVTGRTARRSWQREIQVASIGDDDGVATLWGRRKIEQLLDEKAAGGDESQIREQVLETALRHQILSPYTSFVAVEEQISRPQGADLAREAVANATPQGQSPQTYAYPRTATRFQLSLLMGALLLMLSLLRWYHSRRGFAYVASL